MLKINKCFKLARNFPQGGSRRLYASKGCPMFECKRPEEEEEISKEELEKIREYEKPPLLKCPHKTNPNTYKNIFFFVCIPAIIFTYVNIFYFQEHEPHKRPRFLPHDHLRIRRKTYPWDPVRTLFHHPRYNALPTGYEVEVPEEEEFDPSAHMPEE